MTGTRFSKGRCLAGVDGLKAEGFLGVVGLEKFYAPPEEQRNKAGKRIVKIWCVGGKVKAEINIVHCIRKNNVSPFGFQDAAKMETVRLQIIEFMKKYLQKHLQDHYSDEIIQNMRVKELEIGITLSSVDGATPSDVIALLDMALDRTLLFRKHKWPSGYEKKNIGCLYSKPKLYKFKAYDKTEEQHEKGNPLVGRNLVRIELVFINRALHRMFGDRRSLRAVLSDQGIETACRYYKQVFENDIIEKGLKPFLNYCAGSLVKSMEVSSSGKEISEAVIRHKELIADLEVLRRAVRRWCRRRGKEDQSRQVICYYRKRQLGLPEGVLKTVRAFHEAAG